MKKFKYISYAALAIIIAGTSCNKLDEYNPSGSTADAIYSTPAGFATLVNAAYGETRYWYGKEDGMFLGETGTDLWINENNGTYAQQLTKYNSFTPSTGNPNNGLWQRIWWGVNHANAGIDRIDAAGFTNATEKNQRLAELRFLRAFYYWHIVETWGGVMLRTHEVKTSELYAYRSPVEDFYNLIVEDLLFAKDNLPNTWGNEYSRATKKSALGFLARAYLSRAYYSTGSDANTWFTKARDAALEVINRKVEFNVELAPTPADLWDPSKNKKNRETLYGVSNSAVATTTNYDNTANRTHNWFINNYSNTHPGLVGSPQYGRTGERRLMPTLTLLNLFDENIDARYEASFQEAWYSNRRTGTNGTPFVWTSGNIAAYGKDASVVGKTIDSLQLALVVTKKVVADKKTVTHAVIDRDDIYNANGTAKNNGSNGKYSAMFPVLRKFMDPYRAVWDQTAGYQDLMIVRFSEMYMIAAEAEFKLGNAASAATYINVLRTRAAKPGQTAAMQVSAVNITRDFILDEWAREFCGEFIRWFTLKRMLNGTDFAAYIKARNPDITAVADYHRLRPIRIEELNALLNGAEFGQNPGYQ